MYNDQNYQNNENNSNYYYQNPMQGGNYVDGGNPHYNNNNNNMQVSAAVPSYYDYTVPNSRKEVNSFAGGKGWDVKLCSSSCAQPGFFMYSFCCPCCATFTVRRRLLRGNYNNYVCCAGICADPCCGCCECRCLSEPCGNPQQLNKSCCSKGGFCLCCEIAWCPSLAVAGSRYMARRMFNLVLDPCEERLILFACIFTYCLSVCGAIIGGDCGSLMDCMGDCIWACVLSCMMTQTYHEIKVQGLTDYDENTFYQGPQGTYMT